MADSAVIAFVDCTSVAIKIDIYGIATISYSMIANDGGLHYLETIAGYTGYVTSIESQPLFMVESKWWICNVTIIATKDTVGGV